MHLARGAWLKGLFTKTSVRYRETLEPSVHHGRSTTPPGERTETLRGVSDSQLGRACGFGNEPGQRPDGSENTSLQPGPETTMRPG